MTTQTYIHIKWNHFAVYLKLRNIINQLYFDKNLKNS